MKEMKGSGRGKMCLLKLRVSRKISQRRKHACMDTMKNVQHKVC